MSCMKGNLQIGKIVLSLDNNFILPEEKILHTPSEADGLDKETEIDLRIMGCEIIQTTGILLRLPQVAMGTGQVLFQRFYYAASFIKRPVEVTAMACIYLASKIEEAPRRIRDIMNVFHHYKQKSLGKPISPMILDNSYILQKNMIIKLERRILKELGFSVHIKHPNKLIVIYFQILSIDNPKCVQMAWNYMNDALRTDVFVRYQPETIACACLYLSARMLKVCLPESPPWFAIFQVKEENIKDVCFRLLHLYLRPKPDAEKLLLKVSELERQKEYSKASYSRLNDLDNDCSKDDKTKVDANGFHTKQSKTSSTDISGLPDNNALDSESNDREKRSKKSRRHYDRDDKRYDKERSPRYRKNGKESESRDVNRRDRSRDNAKHSRDLSYDAERREHRHRRHYEDDDHYDKHEYSSSRNKRRTTR